MRLTNYLPILILFLIIFQATSAQKQSTKKVDDDRLLTLDRIYSGEFRQEYGSRIQWIEDGEAYIIKEQSETLERAADLVRYETASQEKSVFISAENLIPKGTEKPLRISSFQISGDKEKVLIFTNTKRVWRSNSKGDYWVYDLSSKKLKQIGADMEESSLMFAKFSPDNKSIAYVSDFNIFVEEIKSESKEQLTFDGNIDTINGAFDWVYEEEFRCRDGFRWNTDGTKIAFWQLDASAIQDFYMIDNTSSTYSEIIPVQYPKVGEDPAACKVGFIDLKSKKIKWVPIPGGEKENFLPRMQWVNEKELLIQQLNRKQNHLIIYKYNVESGKLDEIYTEKEKTWVDVDYPDVAANRWSTTALPVVEGGKYFLRMSETDGWRHVIKCDIKTRKTKLITDGDYDVAAIYVADDKYLYFNASPDNATQRYLYRIGLDGKGMKRLTPKEFEGVNKYNVSPNGKYAVHSHSSITKPLTVRLIKVADHSVIKEMVKNEDFIEKIKGLDWPEISFFKVTTEDGIEMDGRMVKPTNFDEKKKYPVIFHVYGEPAGQVATDEWIGNWEIMMAQKGYVIIDMDNRGTPSLKGSEWRKSIYRKIGIINSRDQAMAAKKVMEWDFIDAEKVAVWGWSGGGSLTLNLLFRYPEIYKTGVSVAPVANQLLYDNIYQERYMGLKSENEEDFIEGSPVTHAKNLVGNLLLVHGTGDDNVHYQNAEEIINELIVNDIQFDMMAYPNRSHGIYEGKNTRKHLYTMITNYFLEHLPVD